MGLADNGGQFFLPALKLDWFQFPFTASLKAFVSFIEQEFFQQGDKEKEQG